MFTAKAAPRVETLRLIEYSEPDSLIDQGEVEMHLYHGKELRKSRYSETGRPYLVTTVTRQRQKIFEDFCLARLLVAECER